MGLWERVRDLAGGPTRRLVADLTTAYHEELRLALQLRTHAERVPYPSSAASLLALAEREDEHAARLREQITRLGGTVSAVGSATPRGGRNYWERLTFDLEDLRAKSGRYRELTNHWDLEDPEAAALFDSLSRDDAHLIRVVADLIARSDPHAEG